MKIKMSVLITGFVFLFAIILAGCGEQDKQVANSDLEYSQNKILK